MKDENIDKEDGEAEDAGDQKRGPGGQERAAGHPGHVKTGHPFAMRYVEVPNGKTFHPLVSLIYDRGAR